MPNKFHNSDTFLRFFYCGRGDTLLVCAGIGQWGLIDCHLTETSYARQRLDEVLDEHKVEQLEFVCLTHPHRDHFHGMGTLLKERFGAEDNKQDGCKFKEYWDTGILGVVWALMLRARDKELAAELEDLHSLLIPLIHADKITYRLLCGDPGSCISLGSFEIRCLAPRLNRLERYRHHSLLPIGDTTSKEFNVLKEQVNSLSAVLAFIHKPTNANILLAGDATVETWKEALEVWDEMKHWTDRFRAIKVSHHGARANLHPPVYQDWCEQNGTVAILSVGPDDPEHPHKEVLELLQRCNIKPYLTCRRSSHEQTLLRSDLLLGGVRVSEGGQKLFPNKAGYCFADLELRIQADGSVAVHERTDESSQTSR
jgi:beta-lactamase superfamily II metal-dependent hydrolase